MPLTEMTRAIAGRRALAANHHGFLRDIDFLPVEHFANDPQQGELRRHGLCWQVGTVVPMLSGELGSGPINIL